MAKEKTTNYTKKEVAKLIEKMAKDGHKPSYIGLKLRDEYGIANVKEVTGKKITTILEENDLGSKIPEDLMALIRKSINLRSHLEENSKDLSSKRGLDLTESKVRRLARYYKKKNKLAQDWKYNPKDVSRFIE